MFSTGCFPCLADFIVAPVVSVSPQPSQCSKGDSRVRTRLPGICRAPQRSSYRKNSAERKVSVSPCQANGREKMRRPVQSLLSMMHHIEVLSTRTRAKPFSLQAYFEIWPVLIVASD